MTAQPKHPIVSREEWLTARKALLAKEKSFTRLRDELSAERRALPWVQVAKTYVFDGPNGKESLADLFGGRSQLIVYHFMFVPDWDQGCKSCSFWADSFNGAVAHLEQRDVSLVAVAKAEFAKLDAFRKRMGWSFKLVSSFANDFNRDFHVSFSEEERQSGRAFYNYRMAAAPVAEMPGISVFHRDADGAICHTYSCYARGLDMVNGAYQLLDLAPKGRDEAGLPFTMAWVRHHDRYGT
jgi:predicted dithiol-disulfide oxidoreductase (DUF899 family)